MIDRGDATLGYVGAEIKSDSVSNQSDRFCLVLTCQSTSPVIELVKFKKVDGNWQQDVRVSVKYSQEAQGSYNYMTESGKPLKCWIKDDRLLLVMSRRMLIYDYNDL